MRLPFKIKLDSFGPYGNDWWGFKIFSHYAGGVNDYARVTHIEFSFGRKRGWDGYQKTKISHIYGFLIYHGKPLPAQDDDGVKAGDTVTCYNDEETVCLREGESYLVEEVSFKVIDGQQYKYLKVNTPRGSFAYSSACFQKSENGLD
jgi:hypothetical protein